MPRFLNIRIEKVGLLKLRDSPINGKETLKLLVQPPKGQPRSPSIHPSPFGAAAAPPTPPVNPSSVR